MDKKKFYDLVKIVDLLREKGGCPWDKEQDSESLKPYLIEETYEVLEAIDRKEPEDIEEELGDLLYQILFHARIAKEKKEFDIDGVITAIYSKMVRRHPHVFSDKKVDSSEQVLSNWEKIKMKEKNKKRRSVLEGVPKELPALLRASRLQSKAARVGFDWKIPEQIYEKLTEELDEFKNAAAGKNKEEMTEEMGDILFVLVNISRHMGIDAEDALRRCSDKFTRRFQYIEKELPQKGLSIENASLDEMESLWEKAKKHYSRRDD